MTADRSLRIGVVLEAFLDWPLDQVMPWLREHAPDVTDLEIGAAGYVPHPHCDVETLLASGWLVVEQDILPRSAERFARAAAEQQHNREFLSARGL